MLLYRNGKKRICPSFHLTRNYGCMEGKCNIMVWHNLGRKQFYDNMASQQLHDYTVTNAIVEEFALILFLDAHDCNSLQGWCTFASGWPCLWTDTNQTAASLACKLNICHVSCYDSFLAFGAEQVNILHWNFSSDRQKEPTKRIESVVLQQCIHLGKGSALIILLVTTMFCWVGSWTGSRN